ncbi:unnamed protein product (macronuclear) [Paramecium tetraurelia]|uniref:Uncharacterized protein n=1 Tax=Paramecium tetraurelia TaxID=5888 RepID=A0CB44_PARTE|nr:uncharacterized protein GSPATT00036794001 [Paramecium tetraurelia]CAK68011.1 unnamed protein product [Paramecium tetraurelia]|eukprot:XP_001435408.1 hypothetical protein (macronuclear) [Paramecium tetraurelia strain d4-2]
MSSNFVFLGLVHIDNGKQGIERVKNIVKITDFPDNSLHTYLEVPHIYAEKRNELQNRNWPFITQFVNKSEYLIVLRREANQKWVDQIRIEEFIIQNLSSDLSQQDWRNKATQILLTWDLAETNLRISDQNDKTSNNFAKYGQIYLLLAVISFIAINILKHFI